MGSPATEGRLLCVSRYLAVADTAGNHTYLKAILESLRSEGLRIDYFWLDGPAWFRPWYRIPPTAAEVDRLHIGAGLRFGKLVFSTSLRLWSIGLLLVATNKWLRRFPKSTRSPVRKLQRWADRVFAQTRKPVCANTAEPSAVEQAAFGRWLRRERPQAVLLNYAYLSPLVDLARDQAIPAAVITHDVVHQLQTTTAKRGAGSPDMTEEAEAALLRRADLIIAIHAEEAETLRRMSLNSKIITVSMPIAACDSSPSPDNGPLLFVASGTGPNLDGIEWFLADVWPRLVRLQPTAKLHICGSVCSFLRTPASAGVVLRGLVNNLADEYAGAALTVAPLLCGGGLKIKVVESFAHGRAVVGSQIAFQGLGSAKELCGVVAESADEWTTQIHLLTISTDRRRRLEKSALQYVRDHFSPGACVKDLKDWVVTS
jgi:glycosyltransferase involved in cell wall biosynthesis